MSKIKKHTLVIAHDAGGAEIIAAYINAHKENAYACYVQGPAIKIFRREHIPFKKISDSDLSVGRVMKKHETADLVLIGSGWMTKIEFRAISAAKNHGLKTTVYLDSWVNYRERFGYPERGWKKNLPDEFWVGDNYAFALAKRYFSSSVKLRLVPNQYLKNIKMRAKGLRKEYPHPNGILFFSDAVPGVENSLESLLVSLLKIKYSEKILIGLHPADPKYRYRQLLSQYGGVLRVMYSHEKDLVRNILSAKIVIGGETMALVVSALLGRKTICIKRKHERNLPFLEIIYTTDTRKVAHLI